MSQVSTIGLDIAKHVFHVHGADERRAAVFSRRLSRAKVSEFFASQPRRVVALEACGGTHHWARQLIALGHDVRLIAPAYVKPFVKRNKNGALDAEAICGVARSGPPHDPGHARCAGPVRPSDHRSRSRGRSPRPRGRGLAAADDHPRDRPAYPRRRWRRLHRRRRSSPEGGTSLHGWASCPCSTRRAASSGSEAYPGPAERTLKRLLILGSSAVVLHASRRGAQRGSWLEGMLARKPRMLAVVALADKMARIACAVLMNKGDYRAPVAAAA